MFLKIYDAAKNIYELKSKMGLLLLSLMGILFLTSCASIGRQFQLSNANQIIIGTSTRSDVRSILGNPYTEIDVTALKNKRMHFGDETATTMWLYIYADGSALGASSKSIAVEFDANGRVVNYNFDSSYGDDKIKEPKKEEWKDFDIYMAKEKIARGKTTQLEVISLLGDKYREVAINKPDTKVRWVYFYQSKSPDEKITVSHHWWGNVEVNKTYLKVLNLDFNDKGTVIDLRGESNFPNDLDKFLTK